MFNNYIITLYFLCDLRILSLHLNFEYNYYCLLNYNKNEQIKFLKYLYSNKKIRLFPHLIISVVV